MSARTATWRWSISCRRVRSRNCRCRRARMPRKAAHRTSRRSCGPSATRSRRGCWRWTMRDSAARSGGASAITSARCMWSGGAGAIRFQRCWCIATPRLALAGDAAHGIHPIAGQGLNLGFRDAIALSELVIEAHAMGADVGGPDLLARYQRARRPDNLLMLAATHGLERLFSNDFALLRLARDLGIAAVKRAPSLKR